MMLKSAVSGMALLALLAGCEKELILPGERFDTRTPLDMSLPSEGNPSPVDPSKTDQNQTRPIALPGMVANADWPQRGGNARHVSPHGALSATPARVWSVSIGRGADRKSRISAAPVVAEGRIYTIDAAARVQATGTNGAAHWAADLTPATDAGNEVSGGGLAYGGGQLFVTTGYGELVALNAATGAVAWRQRLGAPATGAPAVDGNVVYGVGRDSSAWAVNTANGKVIWEVPGTPGASGMIGAAAPAVTERTVLLPYVSGELVAVLKAGGSKIWSAGISGARVGRGYGLVQDITGDPVVSGSTTYVGNAAGKTFAISSSNGTRIWQADEGALGPVLPVGDSLFLINDEARLVRLDAATGAVIWKVEMPYFLTDKAKKRKGITAHYGPVLAGGRIAVASGDGPLRFFNPVDGALVAVADIPGGAATQPALAGGALYVVGRDGQLHAFR